MLPTPQYVQRVYLALTFLTTLAASFIWGVNTLFLLSAGLSNTEAFITNAFFTVGQVLFEVPTGLVADIKGRRASFLLGTITLALSTALYLGAWYIQAPLAIWAIASILLGLGFTFFSGATEAWLVDALEFVQYKGALESVFAKAQIFTGIAMLGGSLGGGVIAQATDLSVPYIIRALTLLACLVLALVFMRDWGFEPTKSTDVMGDFKKLFVTSFSFGWRVPAIRWLMLSAPLVSGVSFYAFYAMQLYLLELYGQSDAYAIAGLAAAIVACAQIVGGLVSSHVRKVFRLRTTVVFLGIAAAVLLLIGIGLTTHFWFAIVLLSMWGLISALVQPVRQAYLNQLIPSKQRATILSFDSLFGSSGGIVIQPVLGRVADIGSYGLSFIVGAVIQSLAMPFIFLARKEGSVADKLTKK
jgi:MFS family permease